MLSFPQRVGILGGGQLARLLALESLKLGLIPVILSQNSGDPAAQIVNHWFDESTQIEEFLEFADFVIIENEFVAEDILQKVSKSKPLFPSIESIKKSQSKYNQKLVLKKGGIKTSPFLLVRRTQDLQDAFERLGTSLVLKRSSMGYDGRGVLAIQINDSKDANDLKKTAEQVFEKCHSWFNGQVYAEKMISFKKEISALVARDKKGKIEVFPIVATEQCQGICLNAWQPTNTEVSKRLQDKAQGIAKKVIKLFGGIGLFAVEMFVTQDGEIFVNEIAPRVHNSGHLMSDACNVSQFEQHLRAVLGLGLVRPKWLFKGSAMHNIIGHKSSEIVGDVVSDGDRALRFDYRPQSKSSKFKANIYWYGKSGFAKNRKLGHINVVGGSSESALKLAIKIRRRLTI